MRFVLLLVLVAFIGATCAVITPKQRSVFPVRRLSPEMQVVKDAAAAGVKQLNDLEGKKMELLSIVSATSTIRADGHLFHISALLSDNGQPAQRELVVSLAPPSTYTLEQKIMPEEL